MAPLLTIVVGTVDRKPSITHLIQSLEQNTNGIDWEMVITDASRVPLKPSEVPKNVNILAENPRLGHARGYNKGFNRATGKWVIWLNDDCEVTPGWAHAAIEYMDTHPWCGLGCIYYSEDRGPWHISTWQGLLYANFGIISKEFGDQIGWFDEDCGVTYGLDNAIAWKVHLSGKAVMGIQRSRVKHITIWDENKQRNVARQGEDAQLVLNKYRHLLDHMRAMAAQHPASPLVIP